MQRRKIGQKNNNTRHDFYEHQNMCQCFLLLTCNIIMGLYMVASNKHIWNTRVTLSACCPSMSTESWVSELRLMMCSRAAAVCRVVTRTRAAALEAGLCPPLDNVAIQQVTMSTQLCCTDTWQAPHAGVLVLCHTTLRPQSLCRCHSSHSSQHDVIHQLQMCRQIENRLKSPKLDTL